LRKSESEIVDRQVDRAFERHEEIRHAMTMVGIYAGIPAGVEGFRSAEIVLAEID